MESEGRTCAWQTQRLEARAGQPLDVLVESAGCACRTAAEAELEATPLPPTTYRVPA